MTSRGLEILSEEECFERLASSNVGRVSVRIGDAPAILPVNYALLGRDIVFRTDAGSKLSAAIMGALLAFEIDNAGQEETAWSVLVVGYAEHIRDTTTLDEVAQLDLEPWAAGARDYVVRIRTRRVTGRSLRPSPSP
jgi:nitroimidazol reductase NimA-like FMN-containing flavoprotein (pyridoxamine 5'-phosphate oxidase superfamily)